MGTTRPRQLSRATFGVRLDNDGLARAIIIMAGSIPVLETNPGDMLRMLDKFDRMLTSNDQQIHNSTERKTDAEKGQDQ